MDLWIRTQDKRQLLKVNDGLYIANGFTDTDDTFIGIKNVGHVGRYAEEERAFEILNEIQHHMVNKYYLTPKERLTLEEKKQLMDLGQFNSKIDLVSTLEKMELKPLNNNVYIYEMPKE